MRGWLRPLKLGTEADCVVVQRLPPSTRSDLAANLSAELLVEQQAPFDPRRGAVPGLRASTFSLGTALFSEECYLHRQLLHLSFAVHRPWLVFLLNGGMAIDLDGREATQILKSGAASLLLTESQDFLCTVFSSPSHVIRLGFDPSHRWTRHGLAPTDGLPLLQPMIQLLRDSHRTAPASDTTKRLSMATQRYVLEALEPLGIALTVASSDPLQVLLDWLPSHLDEDLHLDDLAAVARISTRRLQELCHDRYGCTPMALLRQYRLDALHADLARPQEIFIGIGKLFERWRLPDSTATREAFRSRFGHTPSQLRRRFLIEQA